MLRRFSMFNGCVLLEPAAGWLRRLHGRPCALNELSAEFPAGLDAVLSQGNHVGVERGEFFNDMGKPGAAAVADVPGEELHGPGESSRMPHSAGNDGD